MSYREYIPSIPLRPYVDCYWHHIAGKLVEGTELPVQRCLPLGTIELIVQVDGMMSDIFHNKHKAWEKSCRIYFTGLFTDTALWRARPDTLMFGIRLKPEALLHIFRTPPALLLNEVVDAEGLLGTSAKRMFGEMTGIFDIPALIKIAERYLLDRLGNVKQERNYVSDACRLIRTSNGELSVDKLSADLYISKRQLQRSFKASFGASPKTYQRIIRFRNAYRYARSRQNGLLKWSDVSYESGYADQAHFIRDFREFTGDAPSAVMRNTQSFFQTLESVTE